MSSLQAGGYSRRRSRVEDVVELFLFEDWPSDERALDLGARIVDIIPTPGHHDTHAMVYDRSTRLLICGDAFYPGCLYCRCGKADEFRRSIDRVAEILNSRDVRWILGAYSELAQEPGRSFNSDDPFSHE